MKLPQLSLRDWLMLASLGIVVSGFAAAWLDWRGRRHWLLYVLIACAVVGLAAVSVSRLQTP